MDGIDPRELARVRGLAAGVGGVRPVDVRFLNSGSNVREGK
jgi:hypothetical protein